MEQHKTRQGHSCYSSYSHLMALLAQGWQIEPPVYIRPHWRRLSRPEARKIYHFILWREDKVNLVSILECPEIQRFLSEKGLTVDRL